MTGRSSRRVELIPPPIIGLAVALGVALGVADDWWGHVVGAVAFVGAVVVVFGAAAWVARRRFR